MAPRKSNPKEDPTDDEIVITRIFAAPRPLVWQAWTESQHVAKWWGPRGFTNPVCEWAAQPGGRIHDVMRAPNGVNYPMSGEFREVVAPEKLVFTTGALDGAGRMMFEFLHTLVFTEQDGQTLLTLRSRLLRTSSGSDQYTGGFKAGMTQSWEKLAELIESTADREVVSARFLAASPETVYAAFSNPIRLAQWWGPKGFTNTVREFDLRPGGAWHIAMHGPGGADYPNESRFLQVERPDRIVFEHLGPIHWYRMTMTFAGQAGGTRLTWRMVFASAEECAKVRKFVAEGNEQNFDRLAEHLSATCAAGR